MQATYHQPRNFDHTNHQKVHMVFLLLLPVDGSSYIIITLYALENFFVHLVSGYISFLFSSSFTFLFQNHWLFYSKNLCAA